MVENDSVKRAINENPETLRMFLIFDEVNMKETNRVNSFKSLQSGLIVS